MNIRLLIIFLLFFLAIVAKAAEPLPVDKFHFEGESNLVWETGNYDKESGFVVSSTRNLSTVEYGENSAYTEIADKLVVDSVVWSIYKPLYSDIYSVYDTKYITPLGEYYILADTNDSDGGSGSSYYGPIVLDRFTLLNGSEFKWESGFLSDSDIIPISEKTLSLVAYKGAEQFQELNGKLAIDKVAWSVASTYYDSYISVSSTEYPTTLGTYLIVEQTASLPEIDYSQPILEQSCKVKATSGSTIEWQSELGKIYILQTSTDLETWVNLEPPFIGSGNMMNYQNQTESRTLFYRLYEVRYE